MIKVTKIDETPIFEQHATWCCNCGVDRYTHNNYFIKVVTDNNIRGDSYTITLCDKCLAELAFKKMQADKESDDAMKALHSF